MIVVNEDTFLSKKIDDELKRDIKSALVYSILTYQLTYGQINEILDEVKDYFKKCADGNKVKYSDESE